MDEMTLVYVVPQIDDLEDMSLAACWAAIY